MSGLYLLEPEAPGAEWAPFAGVRPVAELRAGAWLIRERWEAATGLDTIAVLGAHVEGFVEAGAAAVRAPQHIEGPAIVGLSAFAPSGVPVASTKARRLTHKDATVGWVIPPGEWWQGRNDDGPALEIDGLPLRGAYDLITALEVLLPGDCADFIGASMAPVPEGSLILGDPGRVTVRGALVEPGVVFDVRNGAIVLSEGVEVRHGTRLEGPLYAGPGTRLLGGFVRHCAFGPACRAHGELSTTVFIGFANKSHDGFVGHSVLGAWVNLGAGTITSNLKNTYGPVRLQVQDTRVETGRLNLGTLFGDHAKTAVGTMLPTGSVVSVAANVFGDGAQKYVAPFAWGSSGRERQTVKDFVRVAERVMARRGVSLTPELLNSLERTHQRSISS